ncbi:unnamed protein product [Musa hybrid cultivar]
MYFWARASTPPSPSVPAGCITYVMVLGLGSVCRMSTAGFFVGRCGGTATSWFPRPGPRVRLASASDDILTKFMAITEEFSKMVFLGLLAMAPALVCEWVEDTGDRVAV